MSHSALRHEFSELIDLDAPVVDNAAHSVTDKEHMRAPNVAETVLPLQLFVLPGPEQVGQLRQSSLQRFIGRAYQSFGQGRLIRQ